MNNMFENECRYMFDTNSSVMTVILSYISLNVILNRMSTFSECTSGGFCIPFDNIKDEECSPQAWG